MAQKNKPNTQAIQAAAAVAVAEVPALETPAVPEAPVVVETLATYTRGEAAPQGVVDSLGFDRITQVAPDFLSVRRGLNVRDFSVQENIDHVANLREMIENSYLKTPLDVIVEKDEENPGETRIVVYRGESRLRAILSIITDKGAAAYPTIPVRMVEIEDEAAAAADLIVGNSGKSLTLLEQSEVVQRLVKAGITRPTEIGRLLGMTHTNVGNLRILYGTSEEIKQAVRQGWLVATLVINKLVAARGAAGKDADKGGHVGEERKQIEETFKNDAEKDLLKLARKNERECKKMARGVKTETEATGDEGGEGADGRATKGKPKHPDDAQFNKDTYNKLLDMHRVLLKEILIPAKDYRKARQAITNLLEGLGLPRVSKADEMAAKSIAAANADEPTETAEPMAEAAVA